MQLLQQGFLLVKLTEHRRTREIEIGNEQIIIDLSLIEMQLADGSSGGTPSPMPYSRSDCPTKITAIAA
jgi:hypothetical protein